VEQKRQKPTVWAILKPGLPFFISAFSGFSYHKTYAMRRFWFLLVSDNGYSRLWHLFYFRPGEVQLAENSRHGFGLGFIR